MVSPVCRPALSGPHAAGPNVAVTSGKDAVVRVVHADGESASIVETLFWEQISGSTYVDHGQTAMTITGHVVVCLASVGKSTVRGHEQKKVIF